MKSRWTKTGQRTRELLARKTLHSASMRSRYAFRFLPFSFPDFSVQTKRTETERDIEKSKKYLGPRKSFSCSPWMPERRWDKDEENKNIRVAVTLCTVGIKNNSCKWKIASRPYWIWSGLIKSTTFSVKSKFQTTRYNKMAERRLPHTLKRLIFIILKTRRFLEGVYAKVHSLCSLR